MAVGFCFWAYFNLCFYFLKQESEAERLGRVVNQIQQGSGGGDAGGQSQSVETNTDKLKYRLEILKRVRICRNHG
jgi:hypothetical protein